MKANSYIFQTSDLLYHALGESFKDSVSRVERQGWKIHIALPGGSTPHKFFQYLSGPISDEINWNVIHFYWGDERCVPPDHPDSNYGMTNKALLNKIDIPKYNIHRIYGESEPEKEVLRYSEEIRANVPSNNQNLPQFDWIILGLGTDGHTASLFPHISLSSTTKQICTIATQPQSGQKRISLTLSILNNAKHISFLVTGKSKAQVVASILNEDPERYKYPAANVAPSRGILEWYLDQEAGAFL